MESLAAGESSDTAERRANLSNATLREADLTSAILIETTLEGAVLNGCYVYGVSAWNLKLDGADQKNLIVGKKHDAVFTIDNLEVAQFIYLLLNNQRIRDVITTIGQKAVLIGRLVSLPAGPPRVETGVTL